MYHLLVHVDRTAYSSTLHTVAYPLSHTIMTLCYYGTFLCLNKFSYCNTLRRYIAFAIAATAYQLPYACVYKFTYIYTQLDR